MQSLPKAAIPGAMQGYIKNHVNTVTGVSHHLDRRSNEDIRNFAINHNLHDSSNQASILADFEAEHFR